jgi:hypothetical protein
MSPALFDSVNKFMRLHCSSASGNLSIMKKLKISHPSSNYLTAVTDLVQMRRGTDMHTIITATVNFKHNQYSLTKYWARLLAETDDF